MISETKIDDSFPLGNFLIGGDNYGLKSLIRQPTCYKIPSNPACIDLILTNAPQEFQSTCVLEIGLSDFLLMSVTVMRKIFKK